MQQYHDLVTAVLEEGTRKPNRTGIDTLSLFNHNYRIDLDDGFPLLTTKSISWKNIVVENLWFLSGQKHIGLLRKHGCKFWDPWADENGFVPSAYGSFWRSFPAPGSQGDIQFIDQVQWALDTLKENPMSRRAVISAWAPSNAHDSALPPCHVFWVLNIQHDATGEPRLNLHLTQRSADVALGVPYNIAGYSLLLHIFGQILNIRPKYFAHSIVDAHIYTAKANGEQAEYDHIPGLKEQLTRTERPLPTLQIAPKIRSLDEISALLELSTAELLERFALSGYDPHPAIPFKVAV